MVVGCVYVCARNVCFGSIPYRRGAPSYYLEEERGEEELGAQRLALRGARRHGREDLADDGAGPKGGVRGGGGGEGAQQLVFVCGGWEGLLWVWWRRGIMVVD